MIMPKTQPPRRQDRPRKVLNKGLVLKLSAHGLTQEEIASVCDCSVSLITKKYHDVWERGQTMMKASLKRRQFHVAMKGNTTMLVWLGKQHLGQRDNIDSTIDNRHTYYISGPEKTESADEWQAKYAPSSHLTQ
jgi:hypothetical protein